MNINVTLLGQVFPFIFLLCAGIIYARRCIKNKKLANIIASVLIGMLLLPYLLMVLMILIFNLR